MTEHQFSITIDVHPGRMAMHLLTMKAICSGLGAAISDAGAEIEAGKPGAQKNLEDALAGTAAFVVEMFGMASAGIPKSEALADEQETAFHKKLMAHGLRICGTQTMNTLLEAATVYERELVNAARNGVAREMETASTEADSIIAAMKKAAGS